MNDNFGKWYRNAHIEPEDTQLKNRWKGLKTFVDKTELDDVFELIRMFFKASPNQIDRKTAFIDCFYKQDNAFDKENSDNELAVLAGVCLNEIAINDKNDFGNIASLSAECMSFNGKRKPAVEEILSNLKNNILENSSRLRPAEIGNVSAITVPKADNVCVAIQQAAEANSIANLNESLSKFLTSISKTLLSVKNAVVAVNKNESIYHEDSQILWWLTGGFSRYYETPIADLDNSIASLIVSKELADLVVNVPGPYSAKSVLYKILQPLLTDEEKEVALSTSINRLDNEWKKMAIESYSTDDISIICPVAYAISRSLEVDNKQDWQPLFKTAIRVKPDSVKFKALDLAMHFYYEQLLIKAVNNI